MIDNLPHRPLKIATHTALVRQRRWRMAKEARPLALDLGPQVRLDADGEAYFAKCREKLGFVPNVLRAYAFDNAKLKAFIAMADDLMLGESGLTKLEREMIAVAVSSANHCHYCLTAHGAGLRSAPPTPRWAS
jgi:uncharacterized peroxidase-related enzyme